MLIAYAAKCWSQQHVHVSEVRLFVPAHMHVFTVCAHRCLDRFSITKGKKGRETKQPGRSRIVSLKGFGGKNDVGAVCLNGGG